MRGFGWQELLVILVIVLIIFGAARLPQLGRAIGQAIRGFREGIAGRDETKETTDEKTEGPRQGQ